MKDGPQASVAVDVSGVTHRYGPITVLDSISLSVGQGEFVTLLGSSGSGKSTLLRIIAGLTKPLSGRVLINDNDVTNWSAQRRGVGFVFQSYALFPHMTIAENVAYPLRVRGLSKTDAATKVANVLSLVNLSAFADRMPTQLSGGQQQRVAVARALVYEPAVLLMDEPLGALDRQLRRQLQVELRQLQQRLGISCIYVTHDQEEALTMSDRVAVMQNGRILQVSDPVTLYRRPETAFIADFVGTTNLYKVTRVGSAAGAQLRTDGGVVMLRDLPDDGPAAATVSLRPESIQVSDPGAHQDGALGTVETATFIGNVIDLACRLPGGETMRVEVSGHRKDLFSVGDAVSLTWSSADVNVYPA